MVGHSALQPHDRQARSNLDVAKAALRDRHYAIGSIKLCSTKFGLPQNRVRLYIIGIRSDCLDFADPAHAVLAKVMRLLASIELPMDPAAHL